MVEFGGVYTRTVFRPRQEQIMFIAGNHIFCSHSILRDTLHILCAACPFSLDGILYVSSCWAVYELFLFYLHLRTSKGQSKNIVTFVARSPLYTLWGLGITLTVPIMIIIINTAALSTTAHWPDRILNTLFGPPCQLGVCSEHSTLICRVALGIRKIYFPFHVVHLSSIWIQCF